MRRAELVLHLSLTLLVISAATIFAMAEEGPIPAETIPIAVATFFLVDRSRKLRLRNDVISILGLLSFLAALLEFFGDDIEARLLSGGHLLVYLTWVFLLQQKNTRAIWWLCGLSLLQVAVSSLLTYDNWLGLSIVAFLLVCLWTLSVFHLVRVSKPAQSEEPSDPDKPVLGTKLPARHAETLPEQSRSYDAVQLESPDRWVTWRFVTTSAVGAFLSVMLAAIFFLLVPRMWIGRAPAFFIGSRPVGGAPMRTGFTEEVRLGDLGEILESSAPVFTASLTDVQTGQPVSWNDWARYFQGSIRFRGNVLESYESGHWSRSADIQIARMDPRQLTWLPRGKVVQTIEYEQLGPDILFVAGFVTSGHEQGRQRGIQVESAGWVAYRTRMEQASNPNRFFQVELRPEDIPFPRRPNRGRPRGWNDPYFRHMLHVPYLAWEYVANWVEYVLDKSENSGTRGQYETARLLETYLKESPEYRYTLDLSVVDPRMDPVVDFLLNRKAGHCEYYASALAIALRTQNIPTRLISGFKGGRIDQETGKLTIQDLHAHAWLEAYIEDAPPNPITGQTGPRWIAFDPTPSARDAQVVIQENESDSLFSRLSNGWNSFWTSVIRMNRTDQRALVYQPLQHAARSFLEDLRSLQSGDSKSLWSRFFSKPERWISLQGGTFVFLLLLVISGALWGIKRLSKILRKARHQLVDRRASSPIVPFYQRFTKILSEQGWNRTNSQTQQEFASQIHTELRGIPARECRSFPIRITELFYSTRFGGHPIPADELAQLEEQLTRFSQLLTQESEESRNPVDVS